MTIWDYIIIGVVAVWFIYCIAVMIWRAGTDQCMGCTSCGDGSRKCKKCAKNADKGAAMKDASDVHSDMPHSA